MNVTQLMQRLSYGPLSNLSISNEGDGTIVETKHPVIVGYANDALLRLFTRFNLLEQELILEQITARTRYKLHSDFAVSTTAENPANPHYIQDTEEEPYTDDLVKVLSVWKAGETLPIRLGLNDDNANLDYAVFTPQADVLQVPRPVNGEALYIVYQARHALLSHEDLTATIDIPAVLEAALVSYVAHLVYSHMNGQEHAAKAADHLGNYENICAEVVQEDLVSSSLSFTNHKFDDRGFA